MAEGPPLKYIFGCRNFDICRSNLQVDSQLEAYWERFSLQALEECKPDKDDFRILLQSLLDKGVTFWSVVGKATPNAENWKDLRYRQTTDLKEIKEKFRSPVGSSKNRVVQNIKRDLLPPVPMDMPDFGWSAIHIPPNMTAPPVAASSAGSTTTLPNIPPIPMGLLSGDRFVKHGEPFKYIVGVQGFVPVTPWNEQVDRMAVNYWEQAHFSTDQGIQCHEIHEAVQRMHTTFFARKVTFWKAGDGPRDPTGQLIPITFDNWQEFDYLKLKDNTEIDEAISLALEYARKRVLATRELERMRGAEFTETASQQSSDPNISSRSSSHRSGRGINSSEEANDQSLMQASILSVEPQSYSAITMMSAAGTSRSRPRDDGFSRDQEDLIRHPSVLTADGATRSQSQMSAMSYDLSHMSLLDDVLTKEADEVIQSLHADV